MGGTLVHPPIDPVPGLLDDAAFREGANPHADMWIGVVEQRAVGLPPQQPTDSPGKTPKGRRGRIEVDRAPLATKQRPELDLDQKS